MCIWEVDTSELSSFSFSKTEPKEEEKWGNETSKAEQSRALK